MRGSLLSVRVHTVLPRKRKGSKKEKKLRENLAKLREGRTEEEMEIEDPREEEIAWKLKGRELSGDLKYFKDKAIGLEKFCCFWLFNKIFVE